MRTHPLQKLSQFGVSSGFATSTSVFIFALAASFLLFRIGFFTWRSHIQDGVPYLWWWRLWLPIVALTLMCSILLITRVRRTFHRRQSLDMPLDTIRNSDLSKSFNDLQGRSQHDTPTQLRYDFTCNTPDAKVQVSLDKTGVQLTRGLLQLYRSHPDQAKAILAHELSHLEIGDARANDRFRQFVLFGAVGLLALTSIGVALYLIRRFEFHWYEEWLGMLTPIVFGVEAFGILLVYSHNYLVERELLHDLRACELVKTDSPLRDYFHGLASRKLHVHLGYRALDRLRHFCALHPTAKERYGNLRSTGDCLGYSLLYGVLVGGMLFILPVALQLFFNESTLADIVPAWTTMAIVCLTSYMLLRADVARMGLLAVQRSKRLYSCPIFCLAVTGGIVIAYLPLLLYFTCIDPSRFWYSVGYCAHGACWALASYLWIFVVLGYCYALRDCRLLIAGPSSILNGLLAFFGLALVSTAVMAATSKGNSPVLLVIAALTSLVSVLLLLGIVLCTTHCPSCHRYPWNLTRLSPKCSHCSWQASVKLVDFDVFHDLDPPE